MSFPEDMSKNIGKNISQNLSGKYRQKRFDHSKQRTTDVLKTVSEKEIKKTSETTGHFSNKIGDIITTKA